MYTSEGEEKKRRKKNEAYLPTLWGGGGGYVTLIITIFLFCLRCAVELHSITGILGIPIKFGTKSFPVQHTGMAAVHRYTQLFPQSVELRGITGIPVKLGTDLSQYTILVWLQYTGNEVYSAVSTSSMVLLVSSVQKFPCIIYWYHKL